MTGSSQIIRANARDLPLADNSVDLVVTSPPYFALRSYQDGGEHYEGQIGSEPTPAEFVAALLEVTRECVRVLKPSGSLWVNLGDKYAGSGTSGPPSKSSTLLGNGHKGGGPKIHNMAAFESKAKTTGIPTKSLIGIPWRYALACIDDLGLILRAEVIWSKPNGLPESVTDRVRRSHEQWFHFTMQPRYFSAVDEIREEHREPGRSTGQVEKMGNHRRQSENNGFGLQGERPREYNPLGKLPGSVWSVPTQPLRVPEHLGVDHFAAFPMEWPRRIIQGWSPRGVCVECGEGRRPVVEKALEHVNFTTHAKTQRGHDRDDNVRTQRPGAVARESATITGYSCACPEPTAPTTPGIVLDPFGGTGTTALVAKVLGRHGISVDMSRDYCRLAEWRTNDPDQLARALQVEKPPKQVEGQADLFDLIEGGAA